MSECFFLDWGDFGGELVALGFGSCVEDGGAADFVLSSATTSRYDEASFLWNHFFEVGAPNSHISRFYCFRDVEVT